MLTLQPDITVEAIVLVDVHVPDVPSQKTVACVTVLGEHHLVVSVGRAEQPTVMAEPMGEHEVVFEFKMHECVVAVAVVGEQNSVVTVGCAEQPIVIEVPAGAQEVTVASV